MNKLQVGNITMPTPYCHTAEYAGAVLFQFSRKPQFITTGAEHIDRYELPDIFIAGPL